MHLGKHHHHQGNEHVHPLPPPKVLMLPGNTFIPVIDLWPLSPKKQFSKSSCPHICGFTYSILLPALWKWTWATSVFFLCSWHHVKLCQQRALERCARRKGLCFWVLLHSQGGPLQQALLLQGQAPAASARQSATPSRQSRPQRSLSHLHRRVPPVGHLPGTARPGTLEGGMGTL